MMIPKRETPQAIEERVTVKAKYARFFWPSLRWMVLIVAFCAFPPSLAGLLYGENLGTILAFGVLALSTFALIAMTPKPKTLPTTPRQLGFSGWSLVSYCVLTGLGFSWACVFLYFSRQHPFFSAPVIAVTALIMTLYAAIALLVAWLTGGNWRTALAVFLFALAVPAIVIRLGLLR
jgi:hypothetical protein